jgi:hypothetical protein
VAYSYESILTAQFQTIDAEQAQAAADLESARHAEDPDRVNMAANQILQLDMQRAALAQRAQGYSAGQQSAQPRSRFGLSPEESEIARMLPNQHKDYPKEPFLSDDQKEEIYARQRAKLRAMRANGSYRDQTG